jgi:hypothetical protein
MHASKNFAGATYWTFAETVTMPYGLDVCPRATVCSFDLTHTLKHSPLPLWFWTTQEITAVARTSSSHPRNYRINPPGEFSTFCIGK